MRSSSTNSAASWFWSADMRHYLVVEVSGCTGPERPGLAAARPRACLGRTGKNACGPELVPARAGRWGHVPLFGRRSRGPNLDDGSYEILQRELVGCQNS